MKKQTIEAKVLRHLRVASKLSMKKAGRLVGITDGAISHIETGRMDIPQERCGQLVKAYGFSMKEYQEYIQGKDLPPNQATLMDDCLRLLSKMTEVKLKAVYAMLTNFG